LARRIGQGDVFAILRCSPDFSRRFFVLSLLCLDRAWASGGGLLPVPKKG
jgi:hypothetical protein